MHMNWDVVHVEVKNNTALRVRFHDGLEGEVEFLPSAFRGVFACLKSPEHSDKHGCKTAC